MDPAVTAALISAPVTVIAAACAYAAGRAQARGAHRGPVDAVRRQHQRDAYATFHAAAAAFADASGWDRCIAQADAELGVGHTYEDLCKRALSLIPSPDSLREAQSVVELEGPAYVAEAAGAVVAAAQAVTDTASAQIVHSYPTGRIAPDLVLSAMRTAHGQLQEVIKSFLRTAGDHLNGDSAS